MDNNADADSNQSPSVSVTKCANCCAQFLRAERILGGYAAGGNGITRSVYEGLELLFKSRQSIPQAERDSQRLKLCIPCGTPFVKLMAFYSLFLERSHADSHVRKLQGQVSSQFSPIIGTVRKRKAITVKRCSGPAPPSTHVQSNDLPQANQLTGVLPVSVILPQSSRLPSIILPEHLPTSIPDTVSESETIVPDCVVDENFDDVAKNEQEITENDDVNDSYTYLNNLGTSVQQKPVTLPTTTVPKPAATARRNKILNISSAAMKNPTTPTKSNLLNKARILRNQLLQTREDDPDSNKHHSSDSIDSDLVNEVHGANDIATGATEREKQRRRFLCPDIDCPMDFGTETSLDRHKTIEHGIRYPMIPSEARQRLQDLTDEERGLIDSSLTYKCDGVNCKDVNFDTFKEWVVHQEKGHQLTTGYKDIEKSQFLFPKDKLIRPCPLCGKKCCSTREIITHMKCKHFKVRNYPCDICGKALSSKTAIEHHMKVLHSDTPLVKEFLCTYCGAAFTTKGGLTLHENTHLDVVLNLKTITCETCGMAFSSKIFLKKHQFVHTEERNFSCDQCQKTFKAAHHLRGHVYRVHQKSQIRDQVCEICGNAYAFKSSLKEHYMYIHKMTKEAATVAAKLRRPTIFRVLPNGDRVYKEFKVNTPTCSICNRVYVRRLNLCTHLITQHGKTEEEARAITGFKSDRKLTRSPTTVGARTRRKRKVTENAAVQKEVSEEELSSESQDTSDESEDDDEQEGESQMDFDLNMLT